MRKSGIGIELNTLASRRGVDLQSRRALLLLPFMLLPLNGHAQQAGSAFIGIWQGEVPGISNARLIISAVKSSGQVEGRMEFALQSFVSTFGDKADPGKHTSYGMVSGATLTILSALGGKYELTLNGNTLAGIYTRSLDYKVPVTFKRS
jgi:hypothetical protein